MSEKTWLKAAKIIVRASGNPLFQANETMVEMLQTLLNEEQVKFLLNFRKPRLTFQELKDKTGMSDADLTEMLNALMDNGLLMDWPGMGTDEMEYRLLAPVADTFEYSLVKFDRPLEQKRNWRAFSKKCFKKESC